MKTELKPCPFCGGEAKEQNIIIVGRGLCKMVFCEKCHIDFKNPTAIAQWNTRKFDCYAGEKEHCEKFEPKNPPTLFDRITQSPEVLAEKLIYADFGGWWSVLFDDVCSNWDSRAEAIAATVAKLKEVCDDSK